MKKVLLKTENGLELDRGSLELSLVGGDVEKLGDEFAQNARRLDENLRLLRLGHFRRSETAEFFLRVGRHLIGVAPELEVQVFQPLGHVQIAETESGNA